MTNFLAHKIHEFRADFLDNVGPEIEDFKNGTWPQIDEKLTLVHKGIQGLTFLIIVLLLLYSFAVFIGIIAKDESQSKRYGANCLCFTTFCFLVISPIFVGFCVRFGFRILELLTVSFCVRNIRNPSQSDLEFR